MKARELLHCMLDELGRVTDEPGKLTRTFLSPAMERAVRLVGSWMQDVGLDAHVDKIGNLRGRRRGPPGSKTLLLGSHIDTVRDAGKFDGALGVLLPIAALYDFNTRRKPLPCGIEIVGFSEEEGVRFGSAYLGSEGYVGRLERASLALKDAEGVTVRQAIERFSGAFRTQRAAYRRRDLLGYLEVHIEQGPVLEQEGLAVGVVSAIAGQSRFRLTWTGQAGHAGTTPMNLRRDAFTGAAEFSLAAEALARNTQGLVATVGTVQVSPGAGNVIPGGCMHSLDVRHAKDFVRRRALLRLGREAARIAQTRGLRVRWERTQDNGAVACSPHLTERLDRSIRAVQGRSHSLVSGAGHDAVVLSRLTDVAMLFVRCRGGLSHHPDEFASPKDLDVALRVMGDFLESFGEGPAPSGPRTINIRRGRHGGRPSP